MNILREQQLWTNMLPAVCFVFLFQRSEVYVALIHHFPSKFIIFIPHTTKITMMRGHYYFNWNLWSLSLCSCSCEDLIVGQLYLDLNSTFAVDLDCCSKAVNNNFVKGFARLMKSTVLIWIFWLHVECRSFCTVIGQPWCRKENIACLSEAQKFTKITNQRNIDF